MSTPDWTLTVKDFGPIKEATVTLAPLTVFVGKNNTGKSYLASLIWGLLRGGDLMFPDGTSHPAPAPLDGLFSGTRRTVTEDDWEHHNDYLNERLARRKNDMARLLVGFDSPIGEIAVKRGTVVPGEIRTSPPERNVDGDDLSGFLSFVSGHSTIGPSWSYGFGSPRAAVISRLMDQVFLGGGAIGGPSYLPSGRTGLMAVYPLLVARLFEAMGTETAIPATTRITRPIARFLSDISTLKERPSQPLFGIARDIEANVLGGDVFVEDAPGRSFGFIPAGSNTLLPLNASSSLVSELAPFVIFLKAGRLAQGSLIFDEPEAHLHMEAQRAVARALVRLVNLGVQVIITTHSDTLLQQINLCMYYHGHSEGDRVRRQFGYRDDEILDPAMARGYLFEDKGEGVLVRPLTKRRGGFIEPAMNKVITDFQREISELWDSDVSDGANDEGRAREAAE